VLRGAQDPDAPAAVLDHRKDVYLSAIEQVSGEEVQRQDPLRLRPQELLPTGAVPAGRLYCFKTHRMGSDVGCV
jgi:hypothetical protein